MVRKGAVELLDDGQVLDLLLEGEVFGQFSLLAHEVPSLTVRAQEDTLCYLVPEPAADPVLETHAGLSFVIGSMRRRIASATDAATDVPDARLTPVGALVRRSAVTGEPTESVADAAARMSAERVSSLLVPMRGGWGIVTDRDLRTRVVATKADPATPLESIATFPVRTIADDARRRRAAVDVRPGCAPLPGDGRRRRADRGRHRHRPDGPRPSHAVRAEERDRAGDHGRRDRRGGRDLPELVVTMVRARADPIDVGRVIALVVDAMTERLIALDRRARRPTVRLGMARAGQCRSSRTGPAHRSGSRARLRPGLG